MLAHGCVIFLKLTHMNSVMVLTRKKEKKKSLFFSKIIIQVNQNFYHVPFEPYNIFCFWTSSIWFSC